MDRVNIKVIQGLFVYFLIVVLTFLFVSNLEGATFCVSTESELWLALLDARDNGAEDTVRIVEGRYIGSFAYSSEENYGLTIIGGYEQACPPKNSSSPNSVLDGDGLGPVLILKSTKAVDFVVKDLVLQNGKTTSNRNGGGLYLFTDRGSVTVESCTITNNTANDTGGGIYIEDCETASLTSNKIADNNATNRGGGIHIFSFGATVFLTNNTISNNAAERGGGVYVLRTDTVSLVSNTIQGNSSKWNGAGVNLFDNSVSILDKNTIDNNSTGATGFGAGIYMNGFKTGILTNNVITNNKNDGLFARGGFLDSPFALINNTIIGNQSDYPGAGVKLEITYDNDSANIYNNILWGNIGVEGADLWIDNDGDNNYSYSTVNLFNNDFDQSTRGFYSEDPNFHINIDPSNLDNVDPRFISPANDNYHLRIDSPCVNAGNNQAPELPTTDKDGGERIANSIVDMGAYEFQRTAPMPWILLLLGD